MKKLISLVVLMSMALQGNNCFDSTAKYIVFEGTMRQDRERFHRSFGGDTACGREFRHIDGYGDLRNPLVLEQQKRSLERREMLSRALFYPWNSEAARNAHVRLSDADYKFKVSLVHLIESCLPPRYASRACHVLNSIVVNVPRIIEISIDEIEIFGPYTSGSSAWSSDAAHYYMRKLFMDVFPALAAMVHHAPDEEDDFGAMDKCAMVEEMRKALCNMTPEGLGFHVSVASIDPYIEIFGILKELDGISSPEYLQAKEELMRALEDLVDAMLEDAVYCVAKYANADCSLEANQLRAIVQFYIETLDTWLSHVTLDSTKNFIETIDAQCTCGPYAFNGKFQLALRFMVLNAIHGVR